MSLFNKKIPDLPEIPEKERTPLVNEILETCSFQKEQLALKNEISQHKGSLKNILVEFALKFAVDLIDLIEQNRRNSELFRGLLRMKID